MRVAQRFYDEAARHPDLIYRVCDYASFVWGNQDHCRMCSRVSVDEHQRQTSPGCLFMAEELIATILEELEAAKPLSLAKS